MNLTTKSHNIPGKHGKPIVLDVQYEHQRQPKPIVIFCHGYKGFKDWGAWNLVAAQFARAGFFFLKFNFSHNGGTPEKPIDFPDLAAFAQDNYSKQLDDLESVIQWITTTKTYHNEADVQQISLIGHSRGGGIVTLKAAENDTVKKVVSWAGVADFASRFPSGEQLAEWKKNKVYYVENKRTHQQMPHHIQFYDDFKQHEQRLNIKKAVKALTIPYLIIHGTGDSSVDFEEAKKLHSWYPKSKLVPIARSNHVFNTQHPWKNEHLSTDLEEVTKQTIEFLKDES